MLLKPFFYRLSSLSNINLVIAFVFNNINTSYSANNIFSFVFVSTKRLSTGLPYRFRLRFLRNFVVCKLFFVNEIELSTGNSTTYLIILFLFWKFIELTLCYVCFVCLSIAKCYNFAPTHLIGTISIFFRFLIVKQSYIAIPQPFKGIITCLALYLLHITDM